MSDPKPADAREREDQDLADFDIGFQAQLDGKVFDNTQTWAWCNGFNSAMKSNPKVLAGIALTIVYEVLKP